MENQNEKNPSTAEPSNVENENENNPYLPTELINEILLRLPVRSLQRFKCVCTSWFFLISDTHFAKSHFDFNAAPTHRLLLRIPNEEQVESFGLESSLQDHSTVLTLPPPPGFEFETTPSCDNYLGFLGSCRGFVLFLYPQSGDIMVWNPTTRFHKRVEYVDDGHFMSRHLYGFGYDKSTDDYFVVLVKLVLPSGGEGVILGVYSVNTDSWYDEIGKHVNGQYMKDFEPEESYAGVDLNDSLHWLVKSKDTNLPVIIVLHLLDKSFSEISLPTEFAAHDLTALKEYHLRELGGCLSVCYSSGRGQNYSPERLWVVGDGCDGAEIWVMKEYKVQSSWTKAFVMTDCDIPCKYFYPICFIEGGGVVGSNGNGRLMKFNAKGELLEHRKYRHKSNNVRNYFDVFRESLILFPGEQPHNFKEAIKHEEAAENEEEEASELSLLSVKSLPCDFKEATKDDKEETTKDEKAIDDEEAESTDDKEAAEDEEEESTEDYVQ
ncbi:F-box/kelch-repeat protein At3g23880-like [Lotus japonicus]|uniref:F-box/kelch-repeat protein At3g23880-like n=1 Tax=Lotus japonicus TaxID=34305 RepID=UPI002590E331|nr:F-box/kelch-repeat protein At3g23880-like [Lotus japonicus]